MTINYTYSENDRTIVNPESRALGCWTLGYLSLRHFFEQGALLIRNAATQISAWCQHTRCQILESYVHGSCFPCPSSQSCRSAVVSQYLPGFQHYLSHLRSGCRCRSHQIG